MSEPLELRRLPLAERLARHGMPLLAASPSPMRETLLRDWQSTCAQFRLTRSRQFNSPSPLLQHKGERPSCEARARTFCLIATSQMRPAYIGKLVDNRHHLISGGPNMSVAHAHSDMHAAHAKVPLALSYPPHQPCVLFTQI